MACWRSSFWLLIAVLLCSARILGSCLVGDDECRKDRKDRIPLSTPPRITLDEAIIVVLRYYCSSLFATAVFVVLYVRV
jgi:hypothetical protein